MSVMQTDSTKCNINWRGEITENSKIVNNNVLL